MEILVGVEHTNKTIKMETIQNEDYWQFLDICKTYL